MRRTRQVPRIALTREEADADLGERRMNRRGQERPLSTATPLTAPPSILRVSACGIVESVNRNPNEEGPMTTPELVAAIYEPRDEALSFDEWRDAQASLLRASVHNFSMDRVDDVASILAVVGEALDDLAERRESSATDSGAREAVDPSARRN